MENKTIMNAARSFSVEFASAVQEALTKAIGSPWPLKVLDAADAPTRKAQAVQFRIRAQGELHGEFFVEFYEPPFSKLTARLLSDPSEAGSQVATSAMIGVLTSAMPTLSASLAQRFGQATFTVETVAGLAFGGMLLVSLSMPADETGNPVLLYFDAEILQSLSKAPAKGTDTAAPAFQHGNLKLVMDVELNVSLRFGQRQLPLREVLELTSGSVVELDRMVDEPVELLLDGKVIARGEAVIVDGNYGLRVTEVPQSVESLLA